MYLVIENGIVINCALASEEFASANGWIKARDGAGIGWKYENGVFTPPVPEPLPVPPSVTMRQARLALHSHGKLAAVQDAINQLPEPTKTEAQIEWDYASVVERTSPFVAMLTPALGMTDAEMDELFREASNL